MNQIPATFTYHEDPGHAWLAVPFTLLHELAIAESITPYSYVSRDRRTAYLEEDCDATVFVFAYAAR